jgi:hypothetical protein
LRFPSCAAIVVRMLPLAVLILLSQLAAADISIDVLPTSARVEARFDFSNAQDAVRFSLIRVPRQKIDFERHEQPSASEFRDEQERLTWVTAALENGSARLRYRVTGSLARIPIPVPELPAEAGAGAVTISVSGLDVDARFHEGFPRLLPQPDGSAVARLDNVPSFVRRPPRRAAWSVNRWAQLLVVGLVVGASVAWVVRASRRTHSGSS